MDDLADDLANDPAPAHGDETPNVALVRRALEAMAAGDLEAVFSTWAPEFVYYGFDAEGGYKVCHGRDEMVEMFTGLQNLLEQHEYSIVDLRQIGAELIVAHIRTHDVARKTHHVP